MSEVVAVETAPESQDAGTSPESAEPATPAIDDTTWRKRLAGKDQALTAANKEREELRKQLEAFSKREQERAEAEKSELQRALDRIQSLEAEASTARAEATAARLRSEYPLAADLLGDDLVKFDVTRVAEINGRLTQEREAESAAPEPRVDPNSPRRTPIARPSGNPLEDAKAALVSAGNPFYDPNA